MGVHTALREYLTQWAGSDAQKSAVAGTITNLVNAGVEIARIIALGPLAGEMAAKRGDHADGDTQKELDFLSNKIVTDALKASPVAWMGSEEDEDAVGLNAGAPLAVNIDPLDGSSNIDTNMSIGTIFSILPAEGPSPLLQPGRNQIAAGYIIYGPQTALVLSVGQGTDIFWLDPRTNEFLLVRRNVKVPPVTREYAINQSNFRFWDDAIKAYVIDCKLGTDGPRKADFNMRWLGSLVADAFRILTRGGIYIYPSDGRKGYTNGRLRLLYEGNPIAMLIEQAGGACTTGTARMLDLKPVSLHQRVPLVFGSKTEVEEVAYYYREPHSLGDRSPLFSQRGLFRSV
ncbi:MAG: class 1 fructose-bisphosphatase [Rhodomicrobium sp.]|nr:class 1 fructose-bisphosphatase [Rhodomicrobium sp.]